jgi:DNA-binding IclR family transcriptional regulator
MTQPSSFLQGLTLVDAVVQRERSGRLAHNASRLSEATGLERSRVSRLTQELRDLRYLDRDQAAVFSVGDAYFETARALARPWLRGARLELRRLASHVGVSAQIVAADGARALLLRSETPTAAEASFLRPGTVTPIWCTGAGRALLWDRSRPDLEVLLRDVQFVGVGGPGAARSVSDLEAMLERDRANGIVSADEEYVEGVYEYALPIRDDLGIAASIAIAGPQLGARQARAARNALRETEARLSGIAREQGAS